MFMVELTSTDSPLPISFKSVDTPTILFIAEKEVSLIYYSIASCGFLVAFLAFYIQFQNRAVNKRLVLCGYHPRELMFSNAIALLFIIVIIAFYIGLLTNIFNSYSNFLGLVAGLILIGFVYGCYGMLIGSIVNKELEGILAIVLLANIDIGWLQNPVFYSQSEKQNIIEHLPAHYPTQFTMISVYYEHPLMSVLVYAILYGLLFFVLAMIIYYYRMRSRRR